MVSSWCHALVRQRFGSCTDEAKREFLARIEESDERSSCGISDQSDVYDEEAERAYYRTMGLDMYGQG